MKISRPSFQFKKSKKDVDPAEESVTVTKVPRKGVLGKMGLKKKEKTVKAVEEPKPEPVEEAAPAEEPVAETPAEEPVAETVEDAPVDEEEPAAEEREEEPAEEPAEEVEEAPEDAPEDAPVEEDIADEREQPESSEPMSTGFLCGCV